MLKKVKMIRKLMQIMRKTKKLSRIIAVKEMRHATR